MNGMPTPASASRSATLVCVNAAGLINDVAHSLVAGGLNAVDQRAFMVALERQQAHACRPRLRVQPGIDGAERIVTIDRRLAST